MFLPLECKSPKSKNLVILFIYLFIVSGLSTAGSVCRDLDTKRINLLFASFINLRKSQVET